MICTHNAAWVVTYRDNSRVYYCADHLGWMSIGNLVTIAKVFNPDQYPPILCNHATEEPITFSLEQIQQLHDLLACSNWLLEYTESSCGDNPSYSKNIGNPFTCTCEPHNDYDTNSSDHAEDCAIHLWNHWNALVDNMKWIEKLPKVHDSYIPRYSSFSDEP